MDPRGRPGQLKTRNYTRIENERRWLVRDPPQSELYTLIEDVYVDDTRIRLRRLTRFPQGERAYKLTKKFASNDPSSRAMVSIYLDSGEYDVLARSLVGFALVKKRFYVEGFGVDVFEGALAGLVLAEIEADTLDELNAIAQPSFAIGEVTRDAFFDGGNLCRTTREELRAKLSDGTSPSAT
jgi:CYTH domain-containing protein